MAPTSKLIYLTLRTANKHLKLFVTLISLAKTNLFSLWILHLFILIPNDEGLLTLKHFIHRCIVREPSSETLLRPAELVLILSFFSLGGN